MKKVTKSFIIIFFIAPFLFITSSANVAVQFLLLDDEPIINPIVDIVSGSFFNCVLFNDDVGTVKCWGALPFDEFFESELSPVEIAELQGSKKLFAGENTVCVTSDEFDLKCLGDFQFEIEGAFGDYDVTLHGEIRDVKVTQAHLCFIAENTASMFCMGENYSGEFAISPSEVDFSESPFDAQNSNSLKKLSSGSEFTCALNSAGNAVFCTGINDFGQIGNNDESDTNVEQFTQIDTNVSSFIDITSGLSHSCFLSKAPLSFSFESEVKCWGDNNVSQLGVPYDSLELSRSPISVSKGVNQSNQSEGLRNIQAIKSAPSSAHTCAIATNKQVYCWGDNFVSQSGQDSFDQLELSYAQQVTNLTNVAELALGAEHSCALISNGEVKCWGSNNEGQLGQGDESDIFETHIPVLVIDL